MSSLLSLLSDFYKLPHWLMNNNHTHHLQPDFEFAEHKRFKTLFNTLTH